MTRAHLWTVTIAVLIVIAPWADAWAITSGGLPSTDVPEPTSLALLATAVGGVVWLKFRNRK